MQNQIQDNPADFKRLLRAAGLLYLVIIVAGMFAEGGVRQQIIATDAQTTASQLTSSAALFRAGLLSDLVMIVCDVLIGMVFYVLLRSVSRSLALLTAFFRLAQAAVLALNLVFLWLALQVVSNPAGFSATADGGAGLAMLLLQGHAMGYKLALVFFAGSLILQAVLFIRSEFFPNWLGILLVLAAAGYLIDTTATIALADYHNWAGLFEAIVVVSALGGELTLCLWLLFKKIPAH